MLTTIQTYNDIDRTAWRALVQSSSTGTWFQTPEAYEFFAGLPEEFCPFVVALVRTNEAKKAQPLCAVCVGYITVEKNPIKQFFTRRAIIIGGPALAADCTCEEVALLMEKVKSRIKELGGAIYIETRNFNDYSPWRDGFLKAGFVYEEHNNFHINTETFRFVKDNEVQRSDIVYEKVVSGSMGKNRIRDIKTSFRDGAIVIDHPTIEQVREYYEILRNLYTAKVKTPLFSLSFFEALYHHPDGRFILVGLPPKKNDCIEIIGGTVCVALKGKCLYEWFVAGRDGEWKSIFPSSVATYAGIRYAAENDVPRFDMMGAGKPGDVYGVRDFKARFGGELVEHGRFRFITQHFLYRCGEFGVTLLKRQ